MALFRRKKQAGEQDEQAEAEAAAARFYRPCPKCGSNMPRDERMCLTCHHESPAWTQHDDGRWWKEEDGVWYALDEATGTWSVAEDADPFLPNELGEAADDVYHPG